MIDAPDHHIPKKRFGQNFLSNIQVIHRIIYAIQITPEDHIVEIGPGKGALTQHLINTSKTLDLIEIDKTLITFLEKNFIKHFPQNTLHQADVLQFDFKALSKHRSTKKFKLIGNLPYNISTPFLFHLCQFANILNKGYFMLQKEIVNRITAKPHTKTYGRLSVMIQYYFKTQKLFEVNPESFNPIPKVDSAVIMLTPFSTLAYKATDFSLFKKIVQAAFMHKRKTLKNNLSAYLEPEDWKNMNIKPTLRAEDLSVKQFVLISNTISKRRMI